VQRETALRAPPEAVPVAMKPPVVYLRVSRRASCCPAARRLDPALVQGGAKFPPAPSERPPRPHERLHRGGDGPQWLCTQSCNLADGLLLGLLRNELAALAAAEAERAGDEPRVSANRCSGIEAVNLWRRTVAVRRPGQARASD
jgi:hypothetical protein